MSSSRVLKIAFIPISATTDAMFYNSLSRLSKHQRRTSDLQERRASTSRSVSRRLFLKRSAAGLLGVFAGSSVLAGCDVLEPKVYSQIDPNTFLTTEQGIVSTLGASYAGAMWLSGGNRNRTFFLDGFTTDLFWVVGGAAQRKATPMMTFSWGSQNQFAGFAWNKSYNAIREANIVLAHLDRADISDEKSALFEAEARFVRALCYTDLYNYFGSVPLRISVVGEQPMELPRATEEEMKSFIEAEFLAVIPKLPAPGQQSAYGRATSGAARGWLTKFYLNTKQWQKAADMAQEVMDMGTYALYPDFMDMFKVKNERNSEYIWADTALPEGGVSCGIQPAVFPDGFYKHPRTGLIYQGHWRNWQTEYRILDAFFYSFEPGDERLEPIIREYIDMDGKLVNLLNKKDATASFKYWPDPAGQGSNHGNDVPRVRYADVLLARAEALNELNGPNPASIDLINQVRNRAGLGPLAAGDFASKAALRDHLLKERGWEFYTEGMRREDLIRMNKYIESAHERGVENARPYHRRYPLPQFAIDANSKLKQNKGY